MTQDEMLNKWYEDIKLNSKNDDVFYKLSEVQKGKYI